MEQVDRRKFIQKAGVAGAAAAGTAWVAPVVLGTSSAWAWGSCAATISTFPSTNANTNSSGWTRTVTAGTFTTGNPFSGNNGLLGISPAYLGLAAPVFLSEDDPTALTGGIATLTYATSIGVTSGFFYRFTFKAVATAINAGAQILDVIVGGVTLGTYTTDSTSTLGGAGRTLIPNGRPGAAVPAGSNGSNQAPATYTVVYHATSSGTVQFVYQFTLNTNRNTANVPSDDIGVSSPTIECSLTGN